MLEAAWTGRTPRSLWVVDMLDVARHEGVEGFLGEAGFALYMDLLLPF
jgi:hypothetical protein